MASPLDLETHLLLCDSFLEDAKREALRQREAWRAGAGDVDRLAASISRLRAAAEAKALALERWRQG